MKVHVVRTGVANLASVLAALDRVGATAVLTSDADELLRAERVLLPGVGAFGAAMTELRQHALVEGLVERIAADRPTLTICLGLQLLARSSEESPDESGLCVVDAAVTRFTGDVRVPQMGWNRVSPEPGSRFLKAGHAYFANTFKLDSIPAGWTGATSDHGGVFAAAIERGNVLACQFHPELSGVWGAALLSGWIEGAC